MVRLMIRCPVSGDEIFTGIRVEGSGWNQTGDFRAYTRCPICEVDHEWSAKDVQASTPESDVHVGVPSASLPSVAPLRQRYQRIVDCFDRAAREHLDTFRHISDICKAIGVSQRTLSRALRTIRDTTPLAYMHALRLAEVRKALMSADGTSESVMKVAMNFGVRELGRFAVEYRAAFGESPSETLRRSSTSRSKSAS